ncbi:MAG: hypothetical protein P4K93_03980 [Terracidiphilus sp.]|nr:hypothetical protein [Terracidiphilus sp.]MDR3797281.1 hypothetical protein [Terracidiphilus sp.]
MKKFRNSLILTVAVVGLLLAGSAARAESLTLTLDAPYQSGEQTVYAFTGVIQYTGLDAINDGGAQVYLNGDSFSLTAGASLDDSGFFNNAPLSLYPAGTSGDIDLFDITTPAYNPSGTAADNTYIGAFEILGGATPDSYDVLATVDFNIEVTPEPPSWELLALALISLMGMMRWTSNRRQAAL